MRIYSWNMFFNNKEQERALAFIREADFDIFCLQEVPTSFLERLKTLPYYLISHVDVGRFVPRREQTYLVVLSRHEIMRHKPFLFPDYWPMLPWRTRLFVALMRPFNWGPLENRGGMYADVSLGEERGSVRVFNLHLVLAHPTWRLQEFETAMTNRDPSLPTIVCGDFNILEKPHVTPLNWLAGGRITDALRYRRERMLIEERCVAHELTNALAGTMTHSISRSQLDHILLSRAFTVSDAQVVPARYGSDHHPIRVQVIETKS
ncbi:MAG: endonuclease/exonuclease/phosphatase family protein [bacterium]|nr:endonuclease/exonuclease/phosphatase family protein [bacterium]